jgi:transposase
MARSGSRWRDLPRPLGRHEAVKRRYYRWIEMGVLDQILAALAREADLEWLMIDSTIVRAHQHAAGARRQKGGRMATSSRILRVPFRCLLEARA